MSTSNNQPSGQTEPVSFPIPARGPDRHFGFCRSSYYDFEKRGLLTLIRTIKRGNRRGKVLIPYAETKSLINRFAQESKEALSRRRETANPVIQSKPTM
jgi:hypothetical protein